MCIREVLEKKREYVVALHQLFMVISVVCGSVRREFLYNILI
jgi:hypothetical protein